MLYCKKLIALMGPALDDFDAGFRGPVDEPVCIADPAAPIPLAAVSEGNLCMGGAPYRQPLFAEVDADAAPSLLSECAGTKYGKTAQKILQRTE